MRSEQVEIDADVAYGGMTTEDRERAAKLALRVAIAATSTTSSEYRIRALALVRDAAPSLVRELNRLIEALDHLIADENLLGRPQ